MEEVNFLVELRNAAQKKAKAKKEEVNPKFTAMFFKAVEENVLTDGKIDASEAGWLREMLFADGKIDADERKFLERIKKAAKETSPEFNRLSRRVHVPKRTEENEVGGRRTQDGI